MLNGADVDDVDCVGLFALVEVVRGDVEKGAVCVVDDDVEVDA